MDCNLKHNPQKQGFQIGADILLIFISAAFCSVLLHNKIKNCIRVLKECPKNVVDILFYGNRLSITKRLPKCILCDENWNLAHKHEWKKSKLERKKARKKQVYFSLFEPTNSDEHQFIQSTFFKNQRPLRHTFMFKVWYSGLRFLKKELWIIWCLSPFWLVLLVKITWCIF